MELSFPASGLFEVQRWVLSWGHQVRVLAPKELREDVDRTISLMAGGATCGLLWEAWNYWAMTKWVYHLPFLGDLGQYRYFEMPLLGFLGFLPFALECWVVLELIAAVLARCRLPVAEPLSDCDSIF